MPPTACVSPSYDGLQIKHLNEIINPLFYGGAIVGSVVAAYLVFVVL